MTTLDRWLLGILATIFTALLAWLLSTVSMNSGRIAVLEQRTANHMRAMDKLDAQLEAHRLNTESLLTPRRTP